MNIIELARKAWELESLPESEAQELQAFANAVIAARDAELIEGTGEPVAYMYPDDYERMTETETYCNVFSVPCGSATHGLTSVHLYTAEQVAAAVAIGKYALNADRYARERRIAELESERDMWKATAEATVDFEKSQMRLRIESLEAARMAYAKEFALNADGEPDVGNIHANIRAMKDALKVALEALDGADSSLSDYYAEIEWGAYDLKNLESVRATAKQIKEVLHG